MTFIYVEWKHEVFADPTNWAHARGTNGYDCIIIILLVQYSSSK